MASQGPESLAGIALILGSAAILTILAARGKRKALWKVVATPRSKTETAPQGLVELSGFAWPQNESTMSSLAGDECIYYSLVLERLETRGSGKNKRKEWVYVDSVGLRQPFLLVDGTGLAEIDPTGATIDLSSQRTNRWFTLKRSEKKTATDYFSGRGIRGFPPRGLWGFLFGPRYRLRESSLVVGCPVHALGNFKTTPQGHPPVVSPGLTAFSRKVFEKGARELKNVNRLLDKNGDGKVSEFEARSGYQFAAQTSRKQARISPESEEHFSVHGSLAKNEHHALQISDAHEHHLVNRMKKSALRLAVAGYSGLVLSVFLVLLALSDDPMNIRREPTSIVQVDQVPDLHRRCIGKEQHACALLIANRQALQLSPEYVDLYSKHLRSDHGFQK